MKLRTPRRHHQRSGFKAQSLALPIRNASTRTFDHGYNGAKIKRIEVSLQTYIHDTATQRQISSTTRTIYIPCSTLAQTVKPFQGDVLIKGIHAGTYHDALVQGMIGSTMNNFTVDGRFPPKYS